MGWLVSDNTSLPNIPKYFKGKKYKRRWKETKKKINDYNTKTRVPVPVAERSNNL